MSPIAGPWEKLGRAKKHINRFHREVSDALKDGKDHITGYFDAQDGSYVFQWHGDIAPNWNLSLILGDAAHNMRSALDHPSDRTQFPLYSDSEDRNLLKRLKWFPDNGARVKVESLQPYKRTLAANRIRILNDIDRFDKHRFLLMVPVKTTIPTPTEPIMRRLDDGSIEVRIPNVTSNDINYYKRLDPKMTMGIGLGSKPPAEVYPVEILDEIYDLLRDDVLPTLMSYLP